MFLDLLKQLLDYNGVEPPEIKTLMREFDESVQVYFIKMYGPERENEDISFVEEDPLLIHKIFAARIKRRNPHIVLIAKT